MFVLDYIPQQYLSGGAPDSVAIFTAGWAMKFVPLLGKALKQMVVDGGSVYARSEFKIDRSGAGQGETIIVPGPMPSKKERDMARLKLGKTSSGSGGGGSSLRKRLGH